MYLSLERVGDNAQFVFKNTSASELDMSEEELMERFTRGDLFKAVLGIPVC